MVLQVKATDFFDFIFFLTSSFLIVFALVLHLASMRPGYLDPKEVAQVGQLQDGTLMRAIARRFAQGELNRAVESQIHQKDQYLLICAGKNRTRTARAPK